MSILRPVAGVLRDLGRLFSRPTSTLWPLLAMAVVLQVTFWYLATPGPRVLGLQPLGIGPAAMVILPSLILLLVVPVLLLEAFGTSAAAAGLRWGRWRQGLPIVVIGSLVAVPLMYVAALDPGLQRTYPWPGPWLAEGAWRWPVWAAFYALYYLAFEFFFRGFLLRILRVRWGLPAAMWIQAAMATLVHVGKPFAETLAAFPASLLFGVIAVRTRSVLYPALLHLVVGLATDAFVLYHVAQR